MDSRVNDWITAVFNARKAFLLKKFYHINANYKGEAKKKNFLQREFIQFKINYVGLSQHYYNRTNLLDLTSDMEVAKFFAVTEFSMDNDCYVEYKGDQLGVLYYYDIQSDSFTKREGRKYIIDTIKPNITAGPPNLGIFLVCILLLSFGIFKQFLILFFSENISTIG